MADIDIAGVLDSNVHNLLHNPFFRNLFGLDFNNHECPTLNQDDFVNSFKNRKNALCFGMNLQSINAKFDELKNFIDFFSLNSIYLPVLAVQELWEINVEDFQIDGYNFVANVRTGSQGGGAGLYLEKNLNFERIVLKNEFLQHIFESVTCIVEFKNKKKIIVSSLYRPNRHLTLSKAQQSEKFNEIFAVI